MDDQELMRRVIDLLNDSNDASVHLNAQRVVNDLICNDAFAPTRLLRFDREQPSMLSGLMRRGLKSCSQNLKTL